MRYLRMSCVSPWSQLRICPSRKKSRARKNEDKGYGN
jgi:hypothetical protein